MYTVYFAAIRIDRREVVLPLLVAHVHGSLIGEEHSIATITGGHDTVEHIDATLDGLEDVLWGAYPHQVTGTVLGQNLIDNLDHVVHHLCGLSYSQSANRGSTTVVQTTQHVADMLGSILSQVFVSTALHDGEECLVIAVKGLSGKESGCSR